MKRLRCMIDQTNEETQKVYVYENCVCLEVMFRQSETCVTDSGIRIPDPDPGFLLLKNKNIYSLKNFSFS
jgi:hypothetical protein